MRQSYNVERPLHSKGLSRVSSGCVSDLGACRHTREFDPRGIGPQPLEIVEVARLGVEEVNDDIAVVEEYPAAIVSAFSAKGSFTEFAELHLDIIGKRSDVAVGRARSDHEDIGDHEQV